MDRTLSDNAIELLVNSIADLPIEDVEKISNRIASYYSESTRERLVSALIKNVHSHR